MSKNIDQIYTANPITSNASTDLMYFGQSPYGGTNDAAMLFSSFSAQFDTKDANGNSTANNFLSGYATTATAAATTTLTVASKYQQYFTGSTTQTVVLPVTSTLVLGQSYLIVNNSTGVVTVESSGTNTIKAMASGTTLLVTCILTSGTTAASWNAEYSFQNPLVLPSLQVTGLTSSEIVVTDSSSNLTSLATANNGVLITSGAGASSISSTLPAAVQGNITALGTIATGTWNGSLLGSTYGGTGVNNGSSTITIGGNLSFSGAHTFTGTLTNTTSVTFPPSGTLATTAQVLTSVDQTSSTATLAANSRYITDNGATLVTYTLPTTAAIGDTYIVIGGSAGGWQINVASGQTIHVGSSASTASTGHIASSNQYDCVVLSCVSTNTTFVSYGVQGNLTVV